MTKPDPIIQTCSNCGHSDGNLRKGHLKTKCHLSGNRISSAMKGCLMWGPLSSPDSSPSSSVQRLLQGDRS